MRYKKWTYAKGSLIAEKYIGAFGREFIVRAQEELYSDIPENMEVLMLTDLTEATFPNLSRADLQEILSVLISHHSQYKSFNGALVTSKSAFADFEVAYEYAMQASDNNIAVMTFHSLDSALDWLSVPEDYIESIKSVLHQYSDASK